VTAGVVSLPGMEAEMTYGVTVIVVYAPGVIGILMLAMAAMRRRANR